jgi:hypothetical protein
MRTGSASYGPGRQRLASLLRRGYGRPRWPGRIAAWIMSAVVASLAGWQYALLGPLAFEVAFVVSLLVGHRVSRYRQRRLGESAVPRPIGPADAEALRAEARRQAAWPRVPSPGGWMAPAGVRAAWNWTPPPGITPRLDRVPLWVRLWYGTPLADRSAHAWMWYHGGWDVVPPGTWSPPPST